MSKLDLVRLYRTEDIPDCLLQELEDLIKEIGKVLAPFILDHSPSVIISAFNQVHAAIIVTFIEENGLKDAAEDVAEGLMKNIEHISGKEIWGKDE